MSIALLTTIMIGSTLTVIVALSFVLWSARTSKLSSRVAIGAAIVLIAWAATVAALGLNGKYLQPDGDSVPPIAISLTVTLAFLGIALVASAPLRSLLTNQKHLIRLNAWRLLGFVFLLLMLNRQMPKLWALPAGIGDVLVGATAFWVAGRLEAPNGRAIAIAFNIFGLMDLIVAVGLGVATNPGPVQLFHTVPTSELVTHFPLVMVPAFLVPLAFALHLASLVQLIGGPWARPSATVAGSGR